MIFCIRERATSASLADDDDVMRQLAACHGQLSDSVSVVHGWSDVVR